MKTYEATVRVTSVQTWTVTAENADEAYELLKELDDTVEVDETGGETVEWHLTSTPKEVA